LSDAVLWLIIRRVRVRFTRSARRHRIGKARALHVINSAEPIVVPSDDELPERLVWIGTDDRELELEIVGLLHEDELLIIHVMPYRFRRRRP
jgi:hypothetical protein